MASKHLLLFYARFTSLRSTRGYVVGSCVPMGGQLCADGCFGLLWHRLGVYQPGGEDVVLLKHQRLGRARGALRTHHAGHPFLPSAAFMFCDKRPTRSVKINRESCAKRAVSRGDWSLFPTKINGKLALCTIGPFQTQKIFPDSSNYCLMSKE